MSRFGNGTAILIVASLALGCSDDAKPGGADAGLGGAGMGPAVSFATDIHPILLTKCGAAGCHNVDNSIQPGHGQIDPDGAYAATQRVGSRGQFVYERILERVAAEDGTMMPPPYTIGASTNPPCNGELGTGGCLTVAEYELLQAWVEQGTPP